MEKCSTGKKIYYSIHDAEEALVEAWGRNNYREGSGPIGIYECRDCGHYHWTSQGSMNDKLKTALTDGTIRKEQEANNWRNRF